MMFGRRATSLKPPSIPRKDATLHDALRSDTQAQFNYVLDERSTVPERLEASSWRQAVQFIGAGAGNQITQLRQSIAAAKK